MKTDRWISITNTETNRCLTALEEQGGDYTVITTPPIEVEQVKKRSVGKRIREFMKEKNGRKEKTRG